MQSPLWSACLIPVLVSFFLVLTGYDPQPGGSDVAIEASRARLVVHPNGEVRSIRLAGRAEMIRRHSDRSEEPFAFVAVEDLLGRRLYSPFTRDWTVRDWTVEQTDLGPALRFVQQYDGAPFAIAHNLEPTPHGVRWNVSIRLHPGEAMRSVRVNWMVPVPYRWAFWGPNDTEAHRALGVMPHRFVYGHCDKTQKGMIILPLVGLWQDGEGGAAMYCPPDVHKVQVFFDIYTQGISDPPKGMYRRHGDLQHLRISHDIVGLRPGRSLDLAVVTAGVRPDWRGVMGHYVGAYPELFEPQPAARKYEGMYGIMSASRGPERAIERATQDGVTCMEIHGSFSEYGLYLTDEIMADPTLEFHCDPHKADPISLEGNRKIVAALQAGGVGAFPYFYNIHADPKTAKELFASDLLKDEFGKPCIQYRDEPALRAQPGSPFGENLLEQARRMIRAYPDAAGFFVDNYGQQWVSLAHDDGVTMVHNRPAYDLNLNHQVIGVECMRLMREAGKVTMPNKLATIESGKYADMVLVENMGPQGMKSHAFACCLRAFFPLRYGSREPNAAERGLQGLLRWGGTPAATLQIPKETKRAYRPLTDAMIGKRFVFDEDPLTLPDGYDGDIFRIDPAAKHGGDVVVSLVDYDRSWRDGDWAEDLVVKVRLPEAERLTKATWLGVESSDQAPRDCALTRDGNEITISLPKVGAAGILRLSPANSR